MATVVESPPKSGESRSASERSFVLWGVSWKFCKSLIEEVGERRVRLTYDGENLELMSPSFPHESWNRLLAQFIDALTLEWNVPIRSGGSVTMKAEELQRALEPDTCYWIAHEAAIRAKEELDLSRDPPPDLAIEIDVTHSSLDRIGVYQALRVPEVWRFDGELLQVLVLQSGGEYLPTEKSMAFPYFPVQKLVEFLHRARVVGDTASRRELIEWVRREGLRPD